MSLPVMFLWIFFLLSTIPHIGDILLEFGMIMLVIIFLFIAYDKYKFKRTWLEEFEDLWYCSPKGIMELEEKRKRRIKKRKEKERIEREKREREKEQNT